MTIDDLRLLIEQKLSYPDPELARMSVTRLLDIYAMLSHGAVLADELDLY